jgi:hypothetical protein
MKIDTYSHRGNLCSDNIAKRALAVIGYEILGWLIVYGLFLAVAIAFLGIAKILE